MTAPHSLVDQARHPRHQTFGDCNPDGWGVAWFGGPGARPERFRSVTPMWDDPELVTTLDGRESGAFLAAARLASPGLPVEVSGNAPFVADRFAFSLNGHVRGWHKGVGDELASSVSSTRRRSIEGVTDSEVLFALVLDELDRGADLGDALAAVVSAVERVTTGLLNLVIIEGERFAATAYGNSLFVLRDGDATTIASEPLDDRDWAPVRDRVMVSSDALTEQTL